jgi:hypothetical protein
VIGFSNVEWPVFKYSTWFPEKPVECDPIPDLVVEFGPQNWMPATEPVYTPEGVTASVFWKWDDFIKQDIPIPDSLGYDFGDFATEYPIYPTGKKGKKNEGK